MHANSNDLVAAYEEQIAVMTRIMEAFPTTHMRFGVVNPDGTVEESTRCADWCYACKLQSLEASGERRFRLLREVLTQLRRAFKEIAGRKAYEEDLKNTIVNQHVALCELQARYDQLLAEVTEARTIIKDKTPYRAPIPIPNVLRWLLRERALRCTWSEQDTKKLRELQAERHLAVGILMDHGIFSDHLAQGITQLTEKNLKPAD